MTIAFISNVGSRDVWVDGQTISSKDSRELGESILAEWDVHKPNLRLPILVKALDAILNNDRNISHIILFASDQADKNYRRTDTEPFAQIVKRVLIEKYGQWIEPVIKIITTDKNPSDYDLMMNFYEDKLNQLKPELLAVSKIYASVTSGTPAMAFMLLWQGVEVLGEHIHPLYVIQEKSLPISLNIGQSLLMKAFIDDLQDSVVVYQYSAAEKLIESQKQFLERAKINYDALYALVTYALQRFNFNFQRAHGALLGAEKNLDAEKRAIIIALADEIDGRNEAWLLREEIYGLKIDFFNGAYKDGVTHIFAFIESFLRGYANSVGVKFTPDMKFLDKVWLAQQTSLTKYLDGKGVKYEGAINTFALKRILGFMGKTNQSIEDVVKCVEEFQKLQDIRNAAIHTHGGVALQDVENAYHGGVIGIFQDIWGLYTILFGEISHDNPYDALNTLIMSLIEENV